MFAGGVGLVVRLKSVLINKKTGASPASFSAAARKNSLAEKLCVFATSLICLWGLEESLTKQTLGRSPYPCELFLQKKASAAGQGQSVYALFAAT